MPRTVGIAGLSLTGAQTEPGLTICACRPIRASGGSRGAPCASTISFGFKSLHFRDPKMAALVSAVFAPVVDLGSELQAPEVTQCVEEPWSGRERLRTFRVLRLQPVMLSLDFANQAMDDVPPGACELLAVGFGPPRVCGRPGAKLATSRRVRAHRSGCAQATRCLGRVRCRLLPWGACAAAAKAVQACAQSRAPAAAVRVALLFVCWAMTSQPSASRRRKSPPPVPAFSTKAARAG